MIKWKNAAINYIKRARGREEERHGERGRKGFGAIELEEKVK